MDKEQLIAKYLRNELTDFEQNQLNELLKSDSEFKEQFEFEVQVKNAIFKKEHHKNKMFLKGIENKIPNRKPFNKTWYLWAACIVLLVSLGFFWQQQSKNLDTLFANYYQTAQNTTHPIVRNGNTENELTLAFIAYESNNYEQAQQLFMQAYKDSKNSQLLFYEAICYLETGNTQKAIEIFLEHQALNDKLKDKSKWYLALTYLKVKDIENSKKLLKDISENSSSYKWNEAKTLLSKL